MAVSSKDILEAVVRLEGKIEAKHTAEIAALKTQQEAAIAALRAEYDAQFATHRAQGSA
jgi:hypothetical protein